MTVVAAVVVSGAGIWFGVTKLGIEATLIIRVSSRPFDALITQYSGCLTFPHLLGAKIRWWA